MQGHYLITALLVSALNDAKANYLIKNQHLSQPYTNDDDEPPQLAADDEKRHTYDRAHTLTLVLVHTNRKNGPPIFHRGTTLFMIMR